MPKDDVLQNSAFLALPEEVQLVITKLLPRPDQAKLARVCWQFYKIANDPHLELAAYKLETALKNSRDSSEIVELLKNGFARRITLSDPNMSVTVCEDPGSTKETKKPLIELLIFKEEFMLADQLIQQGATLRRSQIIKTPHTTMEQYLKDAVGCPSYLYAALKVDPELVTKSDDEGWTLLHHASLIGIVSGGGTVRRVANMLFENPKIDFMAKNNQEDTPVHMAALSCEDRTTCQVTFSLFVAEAARRGFDFATLNGQGQAVIHIATRTSYESLSRINNVKQLLGNVPRENVGTWINTLSSSGATAFYYAINWLRLDEAITLLDYGANPLLYGTPDRNPLMMIDLRLQAMTEHRDKLKAELSADSSTFLDDLYGRGEAETFSQIEGITTQIEKLQAVKERVLAYAMEHPDIDSVVGYAASSSSSVPAVFKP